MSDYYTSHTDVEPLTKVRAADLNAIDAAAAAAFDKLPSETNLKSGTTNYAVDTGAANAYVVALPHAPASYTDGLQVSFRALNTNTSTATINVNGLGAKSIRKTDGTALSAGDITAGAPLDIRYSTATGFFHLAPNSNVSAQQASASATAAASSASAASTSASNAANSATAAGNSATAAVGSASSASASAGTASTQAGIATTKAGEASTSASNAAGSATTATTQAGIATTKAGEAATSASTATGAATTATTKAGEASTSASNAATSAATAQDWAVKTGSPVSGGEFSAKKHALDAASSAAAAAASASSIDVSNFATKTGAEELTNKTLTTPTINGYTEGSATGSGASFSPDLSQDTVFGYSTTGNATITLPAPAAGKSFQLQITYGGAHSITWAGGTVAWAAGKVPTPTSTASKTDVFNFVCNVAGNKWLGSAFGQGY